MKYWVYINGEVPGSYEPTELAGLPDFKETSLVCPTESGIENRNWRRAGQFPDILAALRKLQSRQAPRPLSGAPSQCSLQSPLWSSDFPLFNHKIGFQKFSGEPRRDVAAVPAVLD